MWKIMMLIWSLPSGLGVVMLARLAQGSPPLTDKERRLLFGDTNEMTWSPWLAIQFIVLAVVFFTIGFFEEFVLPSFGSLFLIVMSLMTGLVATLLVGRCLHTGTRKQRIAARNSAPSHARDSRRVHLFSR
jgi:ABC-type Mn2+/Zn2+ transport system permease subunit